MTKAFASQADLDDKKITFEQLSAHCWAYTAEGDPNSGVIIGDNHILVSDAVKPMVTACAIDRLPRKNERPSDHTPVVLTLERAAA